MVYPLVLYGGLRDIARLSRIPPRLELHRERLAGELRLLLVRRHGDASVLDGDLFDLVRNLFAEVREVRKDLLGDRHPRRS